MVHKALNADYGNVPGPIWSGLGKEVRQQVIQLLAQLAFNLVLSQASRPSVQEQDHAQARPAQS